jgi:hypothetical protein
MMDMETDNFILVSVDEEGKTQVRLGREKFKTGFHMENEIE